MSLGQLFCKHIWKLYKKEYLNTDYIMVYGRTVMKTRKYANYYECIKCDKTKVEKSEEELFATPDDVTKNFYGNKTDDRR